MRSGLPVEYSQGFNPHIKMTFALPLPVGVTSECEFSDISFEENKTNDTEIFEKLGKSLPPDIKIISVSEPVCKAADIVSAEYEIVLYCNEKPDEKKIREFFGKDEIIIMKKTKKNVEKPINIPDYIKAWEIVGMSMKTVTLRVVLLAGGEKNLKPDILVNAICEMHGGIKPDEAEIHRKKVFVKTGDTLELFE